MWLWSSVKGLLKRAGLWRGASATPRWRAFITGLLAVAFIFQFSLLTIAWDNTVGSTVIYTALSGGLMAASCILCRIDRRHSRTLTLQLTVFMILYALFAVISFYLVGRQSQERWDIFASAVPLLILALIYYGFGVAVGSRVPPWALLITLVITAVYTITTRESLTEHQIYLRGKAGLHTTYQYSGDAFAIVSLLLLGVTRSAALRVVLVFTAVAVLFIIPSRSSALIGTVAILVLVDPLCRQTDLGAAAGQRPDSGLVLRSLLCGCPAGDVLRHAVRERLHRRRGQFQGEREAIAVTGWEMIREYFFFGNWAFQLQRFGDAGLYIHNVLDIWAQTGIVPFAAFVIMWISIGWRIALPSNPAMRRDQIIGIALFALLSWMFSRHTHVGLMYFCLGIISAHLGPSLRRRSRAQPEAPVHVRCTSQEPAHRPTWRPAPARIRTEQVVHHGKSGPPLNSNEIDPALEVEVPASRSIEYGYAATLLISSCLGRTVRLKVGEEGVCRIGVGGRTVLAFAVGSTDLRSAAARRALALVSIPVPAVLVDDGLPADLPALHESAPLPDAGHWEAGNDLLLSTFYIASGCWEIDHGEADEHGRIRGRESWLAKQGLLNLPVINAYAELLRLRLAQSGIELPPSGRQYSRWVTCDVDRPRDEACYSVGRLLRRVGRNVLEERSAQAVRRSLAQFRAVRRAGWPADPNNTFDYMMSANERQGSPATFFFICGGEHQRDASYRIDEPAIRGLMKSLDQRGHGIGLHGSFDSLVKARQLRRERSELATALEQLGIADRAQARQHYLRWFPGQSVGVVERAGVQLDSTLGFHDACGFRRGLCCDFPLFDLSEWRRSAVIERPLIVMECALLGGEYDPIERPEEVLDGYLAMARQCRVYRGTFTLLWHNSFFTEPIHRTMYETLIGA